MLENVVPMVVMTGMFAMIFGIVYIRSRENMAMIEKGLNPRQKDVRPRPFINLKWGLLLMGAGLGLLSAFIIDRAVMKHNPAEDKQARIVFGGHRSVPKTKVVVVGDTSHMSKDSALTANVSVAVNGKDNDDDDDMGDEHSITEIRGSGRGNHAIYFALIAIGGGLGLFFSYRIEKKEWLDKRLVD